MSATYRYRPAVSGKEADRIRTLHRNGSRFVTRSYKGWGLGARTRRGLALMLRGGKLPAPVYEIEAVDTGLLRPSKPDLILHRHADITEAETLDPGPPASTQQHPSDQKRGKG